MSEFCDHLKKGKTFNVLGCLTIKQNNSMSNPYLLPNQFAQGKPLTLSENIDKYFLQLIEKILAEKNLKNDCTLIITKEAIFNKHPEVKGFSPIASSEKDEILERFLEKSQSELKNCLIFANIIYSGIRQVNPYLEMKLKDKFQDYSTLFGKEIIDFNDRSNFHYIRVPGSPQMGYKKESYLKVSNKTFVIANGLQVTSYRKRILADNDFQAYDIEKEIRYFNPGKIKKEQISNPEFYKMFPIQICADIDHDTFSKEYKVDKTPMIHVIQSDFSSLQNTPIINGYLIHIDAFEDNFRLFSVNDRVKKKIAPIFLEEYGSFKFLGWKGLSLQYH